MAKRQLRMRVITAGPLDTDKIESKEIDFMDKSDSIWFRNHIIWAIEHEKVIVLNRVLDIRA